VRRRDVYFSPEARDDLFAIIDWIAASVSRQIAEGHAHRLETFCLGLELASERGARRDDIRPGLRIIGFERRVAIAFMVEVDRVTILRLFYGGRDWEASFG